MELRIGKARAGDEISFVVEQRLDEFPYIGRIELPIAVDVDDDVGPPPHRALQTRAEHHAKPGSALEGDN